MSNSKDRRRERRALERAIALNKLASQDTAPSNPDGIPPEIATIDETTEAKKNMLFSSNAKPPPQDKSKTCHCKPDSTPTWKMIAESAAILIGVYVAVIYSGQLKQMVESNQTSRESFEASQGAFIDVGVNPTLEQEGVYTGNERKAVGSVRILWQNSGNTPAPASISYAHFDVVEESNIKSFPFSTSPNEKFPITFFGPHSDKSSADLRIPIEDFTDLPQDKTLLLWGWEVYKDIFPKHPPHLTEFCFEMSGHKTNDKTGILTGVEWIDCDVHNCTDAYCADSAEVTKLLPQ